MIKSVIAMALLTASLMVGTAVPLAAQPIPAGMKVGLAQYLGAAYGGVKGDLTEAAQAMPEVDYGFKPAAAPEMRTYGQLFAHVATGQFDTCATVKGVPNPYGGKNLERDLKSKADLLKALADSFAFCDDVFSGTNDENAAQFVKMGQGEIARSAVMTGILAHNSEMYGIATVYLRAKGLVPPSTARQQQRAAPQ